MYPSQKERLLLRRSFTFETAALQPPLINASRQVRKTLAYRVKESVRALAICHNVTPSGNEESADVGEGEINESK